MRERGKEIEFCVVNTRESTSSLLSARARSKNGHCDMDIGDLSFNRLTFASPTPRVHCHPGNTRTTENRQTADSCAAGVQPRSRAVARAVAAPHAHANHRRSPPPTSTRSTSWESPDQPAAPSNSTLSQPHPSPSNHSLIASALFDQCSNT